MIEDLQKAGVGYVLLMISAARSSCAASRARSCRPSRSNARRRNSHGRCVETPRCQGRRRGRALGHRARQGAGSGRPRHQARHRPSEPDRSHARPLWPDRRHALRAGRAGAVGARRHAAGRDRSGLEMHNQQLAFEPIDYGPLLGGAAGRGSIGGVIAANLSGPRRIKAGAARDHFLGVTAVTGRGDTIKSGGRVVKNVTGYDLCKLFAGSWGTLAAMTDITIKVLPKPETEATVHHQRPRRCARLRGHGRRHGFGLRRVRRRASARPRRLLVRRPAQAGSLDRAAAGRPRALGHAPQGYARRADEPVRPGRDPR